MYIPNQEKLTGKSREVITSAASYASSLNHKSVEAEHLMVALTSVPDSNAQLLFHKFEVDIQALRSKIDKQLNGASRPCRKCKMPIPKVVPMGSHLFDCEKEEVSLSSDLWGVFSSASGDLIRKGRTETGTERILLAFIKDPIYRMDTFLRNLGMTAGKILEEVPNFQKEG